MTLGNEDTNLEIADIIRDQTVHISLDGTGVVDIPNGDIVDGATVIWDSSAGHVPSAQVDTSNLDADSVDGYEGSDLAALAEDETISGNWTFTGDVTDDAANLIYDNTNNWIPQTRLENDSVTVTANDGIKGGGAVALGSSVSINIEPADFAGTFLSDDGADNLTVDIGRGLENDGAGNIQFDEDTAYTFTTGQTFGGDNQHVFGELTNNENNPLLVQSGNDVVGIEFDTASAASGIISWDGARYFFPSGDMYLAGNDLLDADAGNIIYDNTNDWVPAARIEQGASSGLDADTLDGYEGSEFGALAEDESVTGSWDFNGFTQFTSNLRIQDNIELQFGSNDDFHIDYDLSSNELVIADGNGVELIRQPKAGATQFLQGIDAGSIEAPEDSFTQLANASVTSALTAGDRVGYTFALDNQSVIEIDGEADGTGGIQNTVASIPNHDLVDGADNVIYDQSNNHVPQARLENDSVTVTAGDGLKNGGSVALGSSVSLDVEPADFAGTFLSDDGSDNLTVDIGRGLENDGSGNIQFDEDTGYTFTVGQTFSAGLDTQGDITDGAQVIWDATGQEIPDSALGSIDNATLTNDSVTVNANDGLVGGGSVSLGGSIGLDIEPADFAGTFLSDDGADNLTVDIGRGLENDGAGNIQFDEDTEYTFTVDQNFGANVNLSASGSIQDAGTDAITFDGSQNVTIPNGDLEIGPDEATIVTINGNGTSQSSINFERVGNVSGQIGMNSGEDMIINATDNATSSQSIRFQFEESDFFRLDESNNRVDASFTDKFKLPLFSGTPSGTVTGDLWYDVSAD